MWLLVVVSGCSATVTHERAKDSSTGIRYYENAPYLIIYSDGKGGLNWQIRYLPDQTKLMSVSPVVKLSHTEMNLYFQNGVLSSGSATGDSTEIPKAILAAVQSIAPLLAAGVLAGPEKPAFPAPYIYKIVVNDVNVTFLGGPGDRKIQVPIKQGVGP
ncbi:MAG: hypothetical protein JWO52_4572 [Gammaproteobacteria bacterium]|nr:hypothetical protein [Gammaproteobacteria bacterium]